MSLTIFLICIKNFFSSKTISGNKIICGASFLSTLAKEPAAAIQPACLPITSNMNTFVDVSAIEATSNEASIMDVAIYFAAEPKPGQLSVTARSLSTVLGIAIQFIGYPISLLIWETLKAVSAESLPPL